MSSVLTRNQKMFRVFFVCFVFTFTQTEPNNVYINVVMCCRFCFESCVSDTHFVFVDTKMLCVLYKCQHCVPLHCFRLEQPECGVALSVVVMWRLISCWCYSKRCRSSKLAKMSQVTQTGLTLC